MDWNTLDSTISLKEINEKSKEKPVVIFKHSTSCSISDMALNRFERKWDRSNDETMTPYILDLLSNRALSNEISAAYGVTHQSPQVLVIKDGKCAYNASHMNIDVKNILKQA